MQSTGLSYSFVLLDTRKYFNVIKTSTTLIKIVHTVEVPLISQIPWISRSDSEIPWSLILFSTQFTLDIEKFFLGQNEFRDKEFWL